MSETGYRHRRVFTVPPGAPFLETVARALADGRLIEGFSHSGDPLVLSDATIHVPTRRAARELRSVFVDLLGDKSALLPRIRPLGEFDPADLLSLDSAAMLDLPPAVPARERQIVLGHLVQAWTSAIKAPLLDDLFGGEPVDSPVSVADSLWMAASLGDLIDALETEAGGLDAIARAASVEVSDWWQLTLAFLDIVRTGWPAYLAEQRRVDAAHLRNLALKRQGEALAAGAARGPVIIAGSTGSIPATAALMAIVARLDQGAVVLPGYDASGEAVVLAALDHPDAERASTVGHPQFGMRRTVRQIGIDDSAIETLGTLPDPALEGRARWVSAALAPAETTDQWIAWQGTIDRRAHEGVAILHAANEGSEALAIACALRQAILDDTARAALVTPDRNLARRVAAELARFDIEADDSGGTAFALTPAGRLLFLVAGLSVPIIDPAHLLALLRHPLVRLGTTRADHEAAVDSLELMVLRGATGRIVPGALADLAEACLVGWADEKRHKPAWFERVGQQGFAQVCQIAAALDAALGPLAEKVAEEEAGGRSSLSAMATATVAVIEALARDENGTTGDLYAGEAGNQLASLLLELARLARDIHFKAGEWVDVLRALTQGLMERQPVGGHPRIAIWGVLEARLQSVDMLVLGGLNESVWPSMPRDDPFLNRAMKAQIGLALPERRIGLAAHDFQMAMGQKRVLLTRALRLEGAPTVASRWLQRLETLAGKDATAAMRTAGDHFAALGAETVRPVAIKPACRPEPLVPVDVRPKNFSVTEIEMLIADPYAIHARKTLGLRPLEPLIRDPDVSERGRLFHLVLDTAIREGIDLMAEDAAEHLFSSARRVFDEAALPREIEVVWWQRMEPALGHFLAFERERAGEIAERHAEIGARKTNIGTTGITLTGKADRIDLRHDGLAEIIDYKTGQAPSAKAVTSFRSPQLPLEAKLLQEGAFSDLGKRSTSALTYVKLGPRGEWDVSDAVGRDGDLAAVTAETWARLIALMERFNRPDTTYPSRFRAIETGFMAREGDYDHLARVQEWSAGAEPPDYDSGGGGA